MKSNGPLKHVILALVLAVICYGIFYYGIEHRRNEKGPWQVTFTNGAAGAPLIVVDQPSIGITNVLITFVGESAAAPAANATNLPPASRIRRFAQPHPVPFEVPFGKCLFMDTTFLPGTITFELFGHEIELLPRALIIDFKEHPWQSGANITVDAASKPPAAALKP